MGASASYMALLSPNSSVKIGKRHHTTVHQSTRLVCSFWLAASRDREIILVGDGAYAAVPLIQHCQRKPIRVTLVSR